ncbi:hypothetical protein AA0117_g13386 [Alternaria alternata]|uniref:Uncharacterized protein n=1 Tax=Alternaria alternata TaxID=5599 RepID=A0A4Q4MH64_ALTAL|nr:hypothetical protein AA0117_g13386 [Alternaria alternata]
MPSPTPCTASPGAFSIAPPLLSDTPVQRASISHIRFAAPCRIVLAVLPLYAVDAAPLNPPDQVFNQRSVRYNNNRYACLLHASRQRK